MIVKTLIEFTPQERKILDEAMEIIYGIMDSAEITDKLYDMAENCYNNMGEILKRDKNADRVSAN